MEAEGNGPWQLAGTFASASATSIVIHSIGGRASCTSALASVCLQRTAFDEKNKDVSGGHAPRRPSQPVSTRLARGSAANVARVGSAIAAISLSRSVLRGMAVARNEFENLADK